MLALYWAAALVTQILSDAATTVLLGPISLALALALGLPPQPFIVCTALGAVTAFLTPIGHHGNLLILNPGPVHVRRFLPRRRAAHDLHQPGERLARAVPVARRAAAAVLARRLNRGLQRAIRQAPPSPQEAVSTFRISRPAMMLVSPFAKS